jgi:predicted RNA-binding Zn-ribbon protein involved in translation (DUF1610 family)
MSVRQSTSRMSVRPTRARARSSSRIHLLVSRRSSLPPVRRRAGARGVCEVEFARTEHFRRAPAGSADMPDSVRCSALMTKAALEFPKRGRQSSGSDRHLTRENDMRLHLCPQCGAPVENFVRQDPNLLLLEVKTCSSCGALLQPANEIARQHASNFAVAAALGAGLGGAFGGPWGAILGAAVGGLLASKGR